MKPLQGKKQNKQKQTNPKTTPNTSVYIKVLDLTQESLSALLSHTAVLFHRLAWKHSLVSRVMLLSHLFLTIKPAHYVALPIPAVTMQYAILHLLMTHHDSSNIHIMADLVLIISVLSDGRAIETTL